MGILFAFLNVALDVFDHHNGVIDHQASRQGDAKQGQGVDRESQDLHEGKGSNQRNRNGNRGDDGAAPVLQENEDHQNDQDNGFDQG